MNTDESNAEFRAEAEEYFRPSTEPYRLPPPTFGQKVIAVLFWVAVLTFILAIGAAFEVSVR